MRLAILSDIHGNLEALTTALSAIDERNIDEIICLGDIVGYGANPNECMELLLQRQAHLVLGNHDEAAFNLSIAATFNPYAKLSAEWTYDSILPEYKSVLARLPYKIERHGFLFTHASPYQPELWHYIIGQVSVLRNFQYFSHPLCFVGHSHVPALFPEGELPVRFNRETRFIINVGSVGQPRDHNTKLSFGIFDTELWEYQNIRLHYDIDTAADKILSSGLPYILADRLHEGK